MAFLPVLALLVALLLAGTFSLVPQGCLWIYLYAPLFATSFGRRRFFPFLCCGLLVLSVERSSGASYGLPRPSVRSMVCRLEDDSSLTKRGGQFLTLELMEAGDQYGNRAEAHAPLKAVVPCRRMLASGTVIRLDGRIGEDGFCSVKDWQVLSVPSSARLRLSLLHRLSLRLSRKVGDPGSRALARMLVLGESEHDAGSLKELALRSGCSHILALSGMHLGAVSSLVSRSLSRLFGRVVGLFGGSFVMALFVLLVGPKPSLVRALLFRFCLLLLPKGRFQACKALCLCCVLQLLLFPHHFSRLGFTLSYLASAGLLVSGFVSVHPLLAPLVSGAVISLLTLPVSVMETGGGSLGSLWLSAPSSFLVLLALDVSFLVLAGLPGTPWLLDRLRRALVRLLSLPSLSITGTAGLCQALAFLLTALFLLGYAGTRIRKGRSRRYELEVRVRFTAGDQDGARGTGYGHDEEVWTELPDQYEASREDC